MTEPVTTHQAEEDARNADILVYVDGRIVPRAEAVVSVYDSGFLMGDGVWEGLRLYHGRWAFLDEHLDRLFEGAKALDLDIGMDRAGVVAGAGRSAPGQRHAQRRARAADGHARGQDASVPAPVAVALGADHGDHHGALAALAAAPGAPGHGAAHRAACR